MVRERLEKVAMGLEYARQEMRSAGAAGVTITDACGAEKQHRFFGKSRSHLNTVSYVLRSVQDGESLEDMSTLNQATDT